METPYVGNLMPGTLCLSNESTLTNWIVERASP